MSNMTIIIPNQCRFLNRVAKKSVLLYNSV
jgi:hypothetical protein